MPVRTQDVTCQAVRALTLQTFSRAVPNFTPFVPGTLTFLTVDPETPFSISLAITRAQGVLLHLPLDVTQVMPRSLPKN